MSGLITGAQTLEAVDAELNIIVPEVLKANGCTPADGQVAVELFARRCGIAPPAAP